MLYAGKLRHRIVIQFPNGTQSPQSGGYSDAWADLGKVWAAIEPVSAREFVASQSENAKITTRIVIRYRDDINASMRIYHPAKDKYYNIEGLLADKESGLEYLTLPCSEGIRYLKGNPAEVIPVNLAVPVVSGSMSVGATITASSGRWANNPTSYSYKWFNNGVEIGGQTTNSLTVPNNIGNTITVKVIANNSAGNSPQAVSVARTIIA